MQHLVEIGYRISEQWFPHKETSYLICSTNQLACFYVSGTLILNPLSSGLDRWVEEMFLESSLEQTYFKRNLLNI